jgi:hypothetical protein
MTRGNSGYARVPAELYQTPSWVLDALAEHISLDGKRVWEPACGQGQLVRAMERHGATVHGTDLHDHGFVDAYSTSMDFLAVSGPLLHHDAIISNPPYGPRGTTATAFIRHGVSLIRKRGTLALLLPIDFDSAKSRADCFENCPEFVAKIVLRRRIKWFDLSPEPGKKAQGPTENHAWFLWSGGAVFRSPPVLLYGPKITEDTHGEA